MRSRELNSKSVRYVWNDIWAKDVYAESKERIRRAKLRAAAFDLDGLIEPDATVLDIGCGSGELLGMLAERPRALFGLDRSNKAIGLARARSGATHIRYLVGTADALPFASNSFDHVLAFGVIEHVQDHAKILSEMRRVMKPRAMAFISSSNANSFLQVKNRALAALGRYPYGFQRNWTKHDLESMLGQQFLVQLSFFMHADIDMPAVRNLDRAISHFVPDWGRYVCFVVSKKES